MKRAKAWEHLTILLAVAGVLLVGYLTVMGAVAVCIQQGWHA